MSVYTDSLLMAANAAAASGTYAAISGAPASYCTRDDIAAAAAGLLTSPGHVGITYHATGPVSLTQPEIAQTIAQATGKTIAFAESTVEQQRQGLQAAGLPPFLVEGIIGFGAALRAGAFDLVTGDVGRLAGKPATSPLEFLTQALNKT
jgi:NAD(P)H dehydrogenase (quinone)